MLKYYLLIHTLTTAAVAYASEPMKNWPGLPPTQQIVDALQRQPRVLEAKAMLKAAEAKARALKAGPYEINVRLGLQNREVNATPSNRYTEWEGALERSFRLPGKTTLDEQLAEAKVTQANMMVGDALHESGWEFLKAWFEWARQDDKTRLWREQAGLLRKQLEIVDIRIRAGDAPRLERESAQAALAQTEAQLARTELESESARAQLRIRYPGIALPVAHPVVEPVVPRETIDSWKTAVLRDNHELAWAQAGSRAARVSVSRAEANMRPDPAIGIRYSNERGGEEKVLGAYVTIPLPGQGRRADRDALQAESEAAAFQEASVITRLNIETESQYLKAKHLHMSWQQAEKASKAAGLLSEGMTKAYRFGESSLTDTLLARKQAMEAQLFESAARLDALEAGYRLKLDAHELWAIDVD
jgi:cobalt-zinc-cadmium efflux system outer membrane protein